MIKLLTIFLLISGALSAQTGWYLSGDTLLYNDGAGRLVQINKTGLSPTKVDLKDSLDVIRALVATKQPVGGYLLAADIAGKANTASPALTGAVSTTGSMGYAATAGGIVTQATNKATGVTVNKICGAITMNAAALAAGAEVSFVVTNSTVSSTDVVIVNVQSVGTAVAYIVSVGAVSNGSFAITVSNASAGSLSQALVLNYVVIKSVNN